MKNILITGANKGVGFETAKQLAQLGNFIYIGSRDLTKGQQAVAQLNAEGITHVKAIEIDVTNIDSIKKAKDQIDTLDILINNAGIGGEQPQHVADGSMENLRTIFETNYFGAIQTTQIMLPLLRKSAEASIINIASEVGSLTMHTSPDRKANWDNYSAYGSSKTALNAFTVMLSNELRQEQIVVNSATPGYTSTALNDFKGGKSVEEGAMPIVQLAMLADRTVTGKFFRAGGEVPW